MKPILSSFLLFTFVLSSAPATAGTRIKVLSGELGALLGKTTVKVTFDYSDLHVGKKSEEEYVSEKVADKNAKEAGKGDAWKAAWEGDRSGRYHPKFFSLINKYMEKKGMAFSEDAASPDLLATVRVLNIDPGFYSYVINKPAYLTFEIRFSDPAGAELAKLSVSGAEGMHSTSFGSASAGGRIGESFAKGAKDLAKYLSKKIK